MILIKNATTVLGTRVDIKIDNGRIVEIGTGLTGETVYDFEGYMISPGWIDMHTHCYERMSLYYDDADEIGYKSGVTSVVDAGTTGADDIGTFYNDAKKKITRIFALLNISKVGIKVQSELADLDNIDHEAIAEAMKTYDDLVIGLKVRMSASVIGDNGIVPLDIAKKLNRHHQCPLMVHIGSNPPLLIDILNRLESGDIVTHIFNGKANGILDEAGNVRAEVLSAHDRGVIFDVGHGRESFSFDVAEAAFKQCVFCDTISSDIYHGNRLDGPVYSLVTTMNKMLQVGYKLEDVIDMVTRKPAEVMHLKDLGVLEVGAHADFTIFKVEDIHQELIDSNGEKRVGTKTIKPYGTFIEGVYYQI